MKHRLKLYSFDELRVRGSQKIAALAEQLGWSSQTRLPTDDALLGKLRIREPDSRELCSAASLIEHFRERIDPIFFAAFQDPAGTVATFRSKWPATAQGILEKANRVSAGRFDLLGLKDLDFGRPIDWHLEPISGKRGPLRHWSRLDYLDANAVGDKKILWELNRHQYFVTLGQAYWLTCDEKYAQTFIAQIDSWMENNPPQLGINWASSLEIAFRSISWVWALYFFRESSALTGSIFLRILKFLYLNARHLETYLSTYFSPNTHLTGEALGLFYLGTLLPEFTEAQRWRAKGLRILCSQLSRHIRSDGVYFEQSSYYHRYTTDFYTHLLILLRANKEAVPPDLEEKLELLLDHLMYLTRPDGTTTFFGDDDGGRLAMFDCRPANDFRAALSTGASLFGRPDYKYVAGEAAEETLWLLGPEGIREFERIQPAEPAKQSVAFADGGYYIMRDGWQRESNYLRFDCGPHGTLNCGHAHADALSFDLAAGGCPILIDPGTYTYTSSKEMRDWFRGSAAHNSLTVSGEPSSEPDGPFSWQTIARCELLSWITQDRFDYVQGAHDGYKRLKEPTTHERAILFLKWDYWVIRDRVTTDGKLRLDFHLHPELPSRALDALPIIPDSGHIRIMTSRESGLDIFAFAPNGRWRREDGWISHCYGDKKLAPVYVFSTIGAETIVTFLLPRAGNQISETRVREVAAIGGQGFEVVRQNRVDTVMIRQGSRVETSRLTSDFAWTWIRYSTLDEVPEELVLIDGQTLELEGRQIVKSKRKINYLAARRFGEQFRLQTDEGVDLALLIKDFDSVFSNLKSQV